VTLDDDTQPADEAKAAPLFTATEAFTWIGLGGLAAAIFWLAYRSLW
jgi:hypothetical protein